MTDNMDILAATLMLCCSGVLLLHMLDARNDRKLIWFCALLAMFIYSIFGAVFVLVKS